MKLRCLIIDDEPDAHKLLERYCQKLDFLEIAGHFYDGVIAMAYLEKETVDFIFLDIHMPEITGMEVLGLLRQQPMVIFTTAYSEFALQGYEHNTVDYLLKPIRFERFLKAVNKIKESQSQTDKAIPAEKIRLTGLSQPIHPTEIRYAEAYGNYMKLYTRNHIEVVHATMKHLEEVLGPYGFIRVHKSYLLNLAEVDHADQEYCYLRSGEELPLGISYRQQVRNEIKKQQH